MCGDLPVMLLARPSAIAAVPPAPLLLPMSRALVMAAVAEEHAELAVVLRRPLAEATR